MNDPIVLIARDGKGCRQYTFRTLDELKAWTERKPYRDERLLVMPMYNRQFLGKEVMPATNAHAFVSKLVNEAKLYDDAATNLAKRVLEQAEDREQECAFWFLSALSKLASSRPHMHVGDVLKFASEAMPKAAQEWENYVANT